jgi:hypothetical protein
VEGKELDVGRGHGKWKREAMESILSCFRGKDGREEKMEKWRGSEVTSVSYRTDWLTKGMEEIGS